MGLFGSIAKVGLSLAGNFLGASQAKDQAKQASQAAQFNPYDVSSTLGSSTFDRQNNTVSTSLSPELAPLFGGFAGYAGNQLGGGGVSPFQGFSQAVGNQVLPGLFGGALQSLGSMPGPGNVGQLGQLANMGQAGANNFYGQAASNPFLQQTGFLQGMGNQFAGNLQPNAMFAQQDAFNRLSQLARPAEEAVANRTFQRLQNTGRLGFSQADTGANPVLQSMFQGFSDAATQRGLAAQQYGQNQMGMDLNAMNSLYGGAQNFFGSGLNQQQALGQLGLGYAGLSGNMNNAMFGRDLTLSNLGAQRAMQQVGLAQNIFGFGQDLETNQLNRALAGAGGAQTLAQSELDLARLGGNIGGQQATAGGNAGKFMVQQGSPLGGLMAGVGAAVNPNATGIRDIFSFPATT